MSDAIATAAAWIGAAIIVSALATCTVMMGRQGNDYSLAKIKACADAGGYLDGWGNCNPPVSK